MWRMATEEGTWAYIPNIFRPLCPLYILGIIIGKIIEYIMKQARSDSVEQKCLLEAYFRKKKPLGKPSNWLYLLKY